MARSRRELRLLHPIVPGRLPHAQTFLATSLTHCFEELRVSASLFAEPEWYPLHVVHSVSDIEQEHGTEGRRTEYNRISFARAHHDRCAVLSQHAGFFDLFVPIGEGRRVWATLVTGPFAKARPTSGDLIERWHGLTGTHPRLRDPLFARYVAKTLDTLTLEGSLLGSFRRLSECIAGLLAGQANAERLGNDAAKARIELAKARYPDRMWDDAESMIDPRAFTTWLSQSRANELAFLGLAELPEHVVVTFVVGRHDEPDPVNELLQRDAFQRGSVALAAEIGGVVCARVGDHGVAFLLDEAGRKGSKLSRVVDRAAGLAQSLGFRLHAGSGHLEDTRPLWAKYRTAVAGAEQALSTGRSIVRVNASSSRADPSLRELRRKLAEATGSFAPRFDRYLEAVASHSGYRVDPARAHLEAGLERMIESLEGAGALEPGTVQDLHRSVDRIAGTTSSMRELFIEYRRLVAELDLALARPTAARRGRSTQRAAEYVRDHLGEPLRLTKAAKIAGFAPAYFSRLFKREQGMTFEAYRRKLRLDRAKQLLASTSLGIEQIGQLCGFGTRHYFHRAIRASTGMTPAVYRARSSLRRSVSR